jgi:hypothetical protein
MMRKILPLLLPIVVLALTGCAPTERPASYAIYAELAKDSNKLMKNGLNRRVFNTTETQVGSDITLEKDGSITLQPGTYRITGFSTVSMQSTFAPPVMLNNTNYPGYALVYPTDYQADDVVLKHLIALGSGQTAFTGTPSLFDVVYTVNTKTNIAVGHQSGNDLHDEVYLSIYDVAGTKSDYHLFARVAITKM